MKKKCSLSSVRSLPCIQVLSSRSVAHKVLGKWLITVVAIPRLNDILPTSLPIHAAFPNAKIKLADRQKFIKLNFPYFNRLPRFSRTTSRSVAIARDQMKLAANGRGRRRILEKHLIWKNFMSKISVEIGRNKAKNGETKKHSLTQTNRKFCSLDLHRKWVKETDKAK